MKIALLTEKYTPDIGGLAISSERFAGLLVSAGHDVRVFAPTSSLPPSEKRTLPLGGVSVTRFGASKRTDDTLVDWFELLAEENARQPFDLLHAYFLTQAGFVAAYAGKYLGVQSVVSIRGNDIERAAFDPSRFSHVIYALQNASAVTTNSEELARKAKAFVEREIQLIPNGVEIDLFKPMEMNAALKERLLEAVRLPSAEPASQVHIPIIGFAGELRRKKGLEPLLTAYAQVNGQRPVILLIVGEVRQGEDRKTFEDFRTAHPDSRLIVTGTLPHRDLPAYYSLMDVFVHPSLRDGMPNAVLEAMACGKAVIATPVGGMQELLEDGKNGVVVDVNDPSLLAGKIGDLLDDPRKSRRLGENARALIAGKYTPEKELEANLEVYRKLGSRA